MEAAAILEKFQMAISPQQLTIYLYSLHRAVIFAIAQLFCSIRLVPDSVFLLTECELCSWNHSRDILKYLKFGLMNPLIISQWRAMQDLTCRSSYCWPVIVQSRTLCYRRDCTVQSYIVHNTCESQHLNLLLNALCQLSQCLFKTCIDLAPGVWQLF